MTKNKYIRAFAWFFLYIIGLCIVFYSFKRILSTILITDEAIKQGLMLVTFIGGLFGGVVLEKLKYILFTPDINISTWEEDNDNIRVFENKNMDFRFRVKNKSKKHLAQSCSIKITLEYESEDIKECSNAYIKDKWEFSKIEDEHILWDFRPYGKNVYCLNIPPQDSYMVTIARYKKARNLFEIPSEDYEKPRICISTENTYIFSATVYGDNFEPVSKKNIQLFLRN